MKIRLDLKQQPASKLPWIDLAAASTAGQEQGHRPALGTIQPREKQIVRNKIQRRKKKVSERRNC